MDFDPEILRGEDPRVDKGLSLSLLFGDLIQNFFVVICITLQFISAICVHWSMNPQVNIYSLRQPRSDPNGGRED